MVGDHRSRALRLWAASVAILGAFAGAVRHAGAQPSLEQVVERVQGANPSLHTFVVEQIVDVRFLHVFRWRIRTTLYAARPANYRIVVQNPPAWLSRFGTIFSDVSSPEKILSHYRATSIRQVKEDRLVLELIAARPGVNPPAGRLVVDSERWLVEELVGLYEWGEVRALYQYAQVDNFFLPVKAQVIVSSLPIRADITFSGYRLNAPLPPEIFQEAIGTAK